MNWKRFKMLALGLVVAVTILPQAVGAQDTSTDRFLTADQNMNFGRGLSELPLGGSLAWGESYYLESYMTMYEATGDKYWLDKVVDHTDRMIGNASDHDGDGSLGWVDHRYSHTHMKNDGFLLQGAMDTTIQTAVNGSFEVDADADNVPDGWNRQGATSGSFRSTVTGDAFVGSAGVVIQSDGTNENRLVQNISYSPNKTYEIEAFISVDTEMTQAMLEVYNTTTNKVLGSVRAHHVGFERYVFTFKAPASGTLQLRLGLQSYTQSGFKARFDEISMKSVEHAPLVNGSMEMLDPVDVTSPAGWTRWANSTSANVYVSSDAASGSYSIATKTDNTSWEIAEQTIDYIPSQSYTLTFKGKVSSTVASGRIQILNVTDNVALSSATISSTAWSSGSLSFTAPATAGKTIKVRLYQTNWNQIGFTSYFDDLVLFASTPIAEVVANSSFESVNGSDATLPLNWTRATGTASTDAFLVTGINNNYTGSRGLAVQSSGSGAKQIVQTIAYTPGASYVLSYWARTTHPAYPGKVDVYNATDSAVIATSSFSNPKWARQTVLFTAPAVSGKTLQIRISQPVSSSGTTGYVDVVSVKPLLHTEAASWTRDLTTTLAEAHRTSDSTIFADDAGLELVYDGGSAPMIYQELLNYRPNVTYGLSFSGKVSSGATGQIRVYDKTAAATLGSWSFSNTDRVTFVNGDFQTPAAGHDLVVEVSIPSGTAGHKVWADTIDVGEYWEQMVQEGIILSPVLKFVNAVNADASLHAAFLTKANNYRDFVANNMFHKWDPYWKQITGTDGLNNGTGVYIFPEGFSTEWFPTRSLPHNQYLAYARMLYLLHDATEGVPAYAADRTHYWSRANDMARAFKGEVIAHPLNAALGTDANLWNYWDNMSAWDNGHYASYTNEDMSHAALTMHGVMEAYHHGQVFTATDLAKFTSTFTDVMWNQSLVDPVMSWQNSRQPTATVDKVRTNQFHFWTLFAEIDPVVRDIANAVCETEGCTTLLASGVAKWSRNKLVNSDFEQADPTDATLPQHWTRFISTSATTMLTQTDPGMNDSSLSITTNGTTWQVVEQRLNEYEPNTPYTISFLGKRYGTTGGRVQVYDYTTDTILGYLLFTDTAWTRKQFNVTMPVAGHDVRVRLYTSALTPIGSSVGFDDVHAYPSLVGGEVANAGFETADRWDPTLARYWVRGTSTTSANAVLDNTDRTAGHNSLKLISAGSGVNQELSYTWLGYRPSATYTVSLDGKVSGSAGGRLQIIDTTTNTVLVNQVITATSWTTSTATFTAPSVHNDTLKVVLTHDNPSAAGVFWLDELSVTSN